MTVDTKVTIAVISDIHFFNNSVLVTTIVDELKEWFINYNEKIADLIVIPGDIFHSQVSMAHPLMGRFLLWLHQLLNYGLRFNISIRFMEGTPRHDMRQMENLAYLFESYRSLGLDVKYHKGITFEYLEKLNLNCLFVEDRYLEDKLITLQSVKETIENNLGKDTKLDMLFMHTVYTYQIDLAPNAYNADDYISLVDGYVITGHIHTHSQYKNQITPGSFTRFAFNEEEPKGGLIIEYDKNTKIKNWIFKENKLATLFKTYLVNKNTKLDLDKLLTNIPNSSRILIKSNSDDYNYYLEYIRNLKLKYPLINISIKENKNKNIDNLNKDKLDSNIEVNELTYDKLVNKICLNLKDKYDNVARILATLDKVANE